MSKSVALLFSFVFVLLCRTFKLCYVLRLMLFICMVLGVLTMESYEHILDLCFLFLFCCVAPYDYVLNMSIEHGKFYIN